MDADIEALDPLTAPKGPPMAQPDDRNSIQRGVDEATRQGQTNDTNRDTT